MYGIPKQPRFSGYGYFGFRLHLCALDESILRIGRVNRVVPKLLWSASENEWNRNKEYIVYFFEGGGGGGGG